MLIDSVVYSLSCKSALLTWAHNSSLWCLHWIVFKQNDKWIVQQKMKLHEIWWQRKVAFDLLAALFECHASFRISDPMCKNGWIFVSMSWKPLQALINHDFHWHFRFIWLVGNSNGQANSWSFPLFLVCVFFLWLYNTGTVNFIHSYKSTSSVLKRKVYRKFVMHLSSWTSCCFLTFRQKKTAEREAWVSGIN